MWTTTSEDEMQGGWWSGHKVVDPTELESRFSLEDSLSFMEFPTEELDDESLDQLERVRGILDQLPACEADFIDLYFFRQRKQTDIAEIFGVSQPTVCYRLQRATARAKYLLSLPNVEEDEIKDAMTKVLDDPLDIDVMGLMYETTCQSEVAKRLGVSQGKVRHRFIRAIDRMNQLLQSHGGLEILLAMTEEERLSEFSALNETPWTEEVRKHASKLLRTDDDVELYIHMLVDGNVAAATRRWEISRRRVKKRHQALIDRIEWIGGIGKYIGIFDKVHDNLNILREVQRPSNERITHVIM